MTVPQQSFETSVANEQTLFIPSGMRSHEVFTEADRQLEVWYGDRTFHFDGLIDASSRPIKLYIENIPHPQLFDTASREGNGYSYTFQSQESTDPGLAVEYASGVIPGSPREQHTTGSLMTEHEDNGGAYTRLKLARGDNDPLEGSIAFPLTDPEFSQGSSTSEDGNTTYIYTFIERNNLATASTASTEETLVTVYSDTELGSIDENGAELEFTGVDEAELVIVTSNTFFEVTDLDYKPEPIPPLPEPKPIHPPRLPKAPRRRGEFDLRGCGRDVLVSIAGIALVIGSVIGISKCEGGPESSAPDSTIPGPTKGCDIQLAGIKQPKIAEHTYDELYISLQKAGVTQKGVDQWQALTTALDFYLGNGVMPQRDPSDWAMEITGQNMPTQSSNPNIDDNYTGVTINADCEVLGHTFSLKDRDVDAGHLRAELQKRIPAGSNIDVDQLVRALVAVEGIKDTSPANAPTIAQIEKYHKDNNIRTDFAEGLETVSNNGGSPRNIIANYLHGSVPLMEAGLDDKQQDYILDTMLARHQANGDINGNSVKFSTNDITFANNLAIFIKQLASIK